MDLQEFLHSFADGDGKLPSDFDQLKTEGYYLIHGDTERAFCLKEREIYLKDTMENLLARSLCYFSDMPVSYEVHVKTAGRADIAVLDNRRLAMEIKEKQIKGKAITVRYKDGTVDKGPLKTEKYIRGPFGEKVDTIHYACVADSLLQMRRKVYSASYEAVNERSLSAAVREIHRKRERTLPLKPSAFLWTAIEDIKLLEVIRQTGYLYGVPDEVRISKLKELIEKEGYMKISPKQAEQAKKFNLPCFTLQKGGIIGYARDIQPGEKAALLLMKKDWLKMLDILINEKPVHCSRELLVSLKMEARAAVSSAKNEENKAAFASIANKLTYFLEAIDAHNLKHILKGQTGDFLLPEFLSVDEKKKLSKPYPFPVQKNMVVAERKSRYPEAKTR